MRNGNWPDFLFTGAVRFVCGIVLGGLVCFLITWRGILRAFSHNDTTAPFIWLAVCGLLGGIVAVFTVPRWQTPWYKRESHTLDPSAEWASLGEVGAQGGAKVVKKSLSIEVVGQDGKRREYSSLAEVPPEIRSELEALEKEAARQRGDSLSVTETSHAGNVTTSKIFRRKKVSVYKITDPSGVERTYHSLEEMPPELRAAIAQAEEGSKT